MIDEDQGRKRGSDSCIIITYLFAFHHTSLPDLWTPNWMLYYVCTRRQGQPANYHVHLEYCHVKTSLERNKREPNDHWDDAAFSPVTPQNSRSWLFCGSASCRSRFWSSSACMAIPGTLEVNNWRINILKDASIRHSTGRTDSYSARYARSRRSGYWICFSNDQFLLLIRSLPVSNFGYPPRLLKESSRTLTAPAAIIADSSDYLMTLSKITGKYVFAIGANINLSRKPYIRHITLARST